MIDSISHIITTISLTCIIAAFVICIASLLRFKYVLTRLVILEVIANIFVSLIVIYSLKHGNVYLIDISIVLMLTLFVCIVAYYIFFSHPGDGHDRFNW